MVNKYELEEIHTDFEISIGEACRMVYPEVNIKYCIWHIKRALILKKKEICKEEVAACDNCYILYNMLCNLYLCPIEYVLIFFVKLKIILTTKNLTNLLNIMKIIILIYIIIKDGIFLIILGI